MLPKYHVELFIKTMIQINRGFIPADFGWINPASPPHNHNNVVVLIFSLTEDLYLEVIGYFEHGQWNLHGENDEYKICGWFPFPFSPHNN